MNKFAIITGGSRGIGYYVAKFLAENSYNLCLIAKNEERLKKAAKDIAQSNAKISVDSLAIDLSKPKSAFNAIKSYVDSLDNIDVLFNNAGVLTPGCDEINIDDFEYMQNVNVTSMYAVAKACAAKMVQAHKGYIFNVSSMAGRRGLSTLGGYCATKFAVTGFTESLHKKYAPLGVKVTAICPSVIDTDMTKDSDLDNDKKIEPMDIVHTVNYLLSISPKAVVPIIEVQCRALVG